MKTLRFTKVRDVKSPERGTSKSAGIDFFVPNDSEMLVIPPHRDALIPSGIKADIPEGYMLMAADKSGVVTSLDACLRIHRKPKKEAFLGAVIIGAKIVDEDYQGEIHIHLINTSNMAVRIKPGMKIAQFILAPVDYCKLVEVPKDKLFAETTERGEGGFGSTGGM